MIFRFGFVDEHLDLTAEQGCGYFQVNVDCPAAIDTQSTLMAMTSTMWLA